jgi:hypothetical protein
MNESMSPASEALVLEAPLEQEVSLPVQPIQPVLEETLPPSQPEAAKPSVLNMGHWDGDDQDDDELDFGFGGFGNDKEEKSAPVPAAQELPTAANHASPARPPPGLSMPPMPAGAMLVHELENKLENTTLGQPALNQDEKAEPKDASAPSNSQPQSFGDQNASNYPMNQYGAYGGMGMYNMNTNNGGFGSMPPGQFPLGGPLGQQQPKQTLGGPNQNQRAGTSPSLQQGAGAPYGQTPDGSTPNDQQLPSGNQPPNMPVCKVTPIQPSCTVNTIKWATPTLECNTVTPAKVNNSASKAGSDTIKSCLVEVTVLPTDTMEDITETTPIILT